MRILVTGGAGYIGSHMAKLLVETGAEVTVLDDLSTGHAEAVGGRDFVKGDIADVAFTKKLLQEKSIEAVVHFAASSLVGESMADPLKYYRRNVGGTAALLQAMREANVMRIVFSSTAAVYGDPVRIPIDEAHPTQPVNPYGASKLAVERMLSDCSAAYGIGAVVLRYFNAAGADPSGQLGERHEPETHLIPLVLQAAAGRRDSISVYGNDWPTRDGTCVRDYIHVSDLCIAHLQALEWLAKGGRYECFNLGNGEGATVLEVIEAAKRVTGKQFKVNMTARRAGDPPSLVADANKARRVLGWQPARADIEGIVRDAWNFEQRRTR
ncbi:MAG TPA: UDP-glucose 4-epimerase GalE [Burkholderiales bacterium]|nr:UDP-glucose 4-epimerase GalE [Burkholderiales bacterium]